MMKKRRLYKSLRFKVTIGVLLPLLIILSVFSYVRHTRYQALLMDNLQVSAANAGEIIEGSLQHAMISNDFSTLKQMVDDIGHQPGVRDLLLLNKSGHVLVSTDDEMAGKTIDLDAVTCQACHGHKAASRNENVVLALEGNGERVFRNVNAIENTPECTSCHGSDPPILGVLISDFDMAPVDEALAIDRRSSLLWSSVSILLIVLSADLLMSKMVISRLEHFVRVVKRVSAGDLDARVRSENPDEVGELARSFNYIADGLKEKARREEGLKEQTKQLQAQAEQLATLNTLATTVSQSLNLKEVLDGALDKVLELMRLRAGWIILQDGQDREFDLMASRGLPEQLALAHVRCAGNQCVRPEVLKAGRSKVFHNSAEQACPTAAYFAKEGLIFRACVPLTSKKRVLGVMSLAGDASYGVRSLMQDTLEMLAAIGRQIGIAVENASLYEELRREEILRKQLLERMITAQEDERRRIARELHDEAGQALTSLLVGLRAMERTDDLAKLHAMTANLREVVTQTLDEVHDLALELRPSVLDDLGLVPALDRYVQSCPTRFNFQADFVTTGIDNLRLPPAVETTLYRIAQEALTNVARHANASHTSVLLQQHEGVIVLVVEDDGEGFDVAQMMTSPQKRERLGLYGVEERASLVGGELTVESEPGVGTTLSIEIPLEETWLVRSGKSSNQVPLSAS
jgi:signal transduction histidine kinase/HAMP domain-containing protein